MQQNEWLAKRLDYIRGLTAPSEQQRLLLALCEQPELSATDSRKLAILVRAEKAAERALKARADAARVMNAERRAARKARDHELYKAAGLLSVAGVVDRETGTLNVDAGTLVGMLMGFMARTVNPDSEQEQRWKSRGDAEIAARMKKKKTDVKEGL
ncbi:TPA: conjugal transfer protein TraD [Escherichia coli]|nr:conjugal transfer protein TraD [Escherichia coli]